MLRFSTAFFMLLTCLSMSSCGPLQATHFASVVSFEVNNFGGQNVCPNGIKAQISKGNVTITSPVMPTEVAAWHAPDASMLKTGDPIYIIEAWCYTGSATPGHIKIRRSSYTNRPSYSLFVTLPDPDNGQGFYPEAVENTILERTLPSPYITETY